MIQIAGGIILAFFFILCIPLVLRLLGPIVVGIIYIIGAPFMLYGWIKRKLRH